jgi:hypothetical protein
VDWWIKHSPSPGENGKRRPIIVLLWTTRTYTPTGNNFDEIRFEDLKGKEELHIQAEKDMSTPVEHNQTLQMGVDRSIELGRDEDTVIKDGGSVRHCQLPHLHDLPGPSRTRRGGSGRHHRDQSRQSGVHPGRLQRLSRAHALCHPAGPAHGCAGELHLPPLLGLLGSRHGQPGRQIGADPGETVAQTRRMRTAPLWGIKVRNHLLHNVRTSEIAMAIRAHDGQGAGARNAFLALSTADQHALVQFVRSIGYDTP